MELSNEIIQQIVNGLVTGGVYALVAVGLTMIFGILDIVNFAHGELYMLGAYGTLIFASSLGLPIFAAIILSAIVIGILGLLLEKLIFRPIRTSPQTNTIIVSMGLSIFLSNAALLIWTPDPRMIESPFNGTLVIGEIRIAYARLFILIASILIVAALQYFVRRTWMGNAMRAVAQDSIAARLMGININKVAMTTFFIGAGLAAVAGGLIGPLYVVEPKMGFDIGIKAFAVVILGGVGNVSGAILAALLLGVTENLTAGFIATGLKDFVSFLILILVLLVKPSGLWGVKAIEK